MGQSPQSTLAIPAFQIEPVDLSTMPAPSFKIDPVDLSAQKSFVDQLGEMLGTYITEINPIPSLYKANLETAGIIQQALEGKLKESGSRAIADLKGLASSVGQAQSVPFQRGVEAFKDGKVGESVGHFMNWLIPLVGPRMDEASTEGQQGNWGNAAGIAAGTATNLFVPPALGEMRAAPVGVATSALPDEAIHSGMMPRSAAPMTPPVAPGLPRNAPATEVAAFADANQIPISAGTRADSNVLKSVQQGNAATSFMAEKAEEAAQAAQAARVGQVGQNIAADVFPTAQTPETAGQAAQGAVDRTNIGVSGAYERSAAGIANRVSPTASTPYTAGQGVHAELDDLAGQFGTQADEHYSAVREGAKAKAKDVVVGYEPSQMRTSGGDPAYQQPIVRSIDFPIDISDLQTDLSDLHGKLKREWPLAQRQASPGFTALENLVNSPSVMALEEAEDALGAVKAVARKATGRAGGLAKLVVSKMEQAIARSVKDAGGEAVLASLKSGRAATAQKYAIKDLISELSTEPARATAALTGAGDVSADLLKRVAAAAPQATQQLARAFLQSVFDIMLQDGKLDVARAVAAARKWEATGEVTKQILYPAAVRKQIDLFFRYANRAASDPIVPNLQESAVRAFETLVQNKDANIAQLEAISRVAPEIPAQLGRAWLEMKLAQMGEKVGSLSHGAAIRADWLRLGARTRKLLFGQNEKNIGTFLQLVSDESFVGNSSRTAYMEILMSTAVSGVGMFLHNPLAISGPAAFALFRWQVQKMLWNPTASKALIDAMKVPVASKDAAVVASARVINAAKSMGLEVHPIDVTAGKGAVQTGRGLNLVKGASVPGVPKAADGQPQPPAPVTVGRFQVTEQPGQ